MLSPLFKHGLCPKGDVLVAVSLLVRGKGKSTFGELKKLLALVAEFIFVIQKLKNIEGRFLRKFSFFSDFENEKNLR